MTYYDYFSPFNMAELFKPSPSVYVISDSQMAEYKRANTLQEIAAVEKLIESHKESIERLESTVELLKRELPALPEEDKVSEK